MVVTSGRWRDVDPADIRDLNTWADTVNGIYLETKAERGGTRYGLPQLQKLIDGKRLDGGTRQQKIELIGPTVTAWRGGKVPSEGLVDTFVALLWACGVPAQHLDAWRVSVVRMRQLRDQPQAVLVDPDPTGLIGVLTQIRRQALDERLPRYLPDGVDVLRLNRQVRVHRGVRIAVADGPERDQQSLPSEQRRDQQPELWTSFIAGQERVVVLADPGLGKSWLLRLEAARLAETAIAQLEKARTDGSPSVPDGLLVPVRIRGDQLAALPGDTMVDRLLTYLDRSMGWQPVTRQNLRELFMGGRVVLLLDAWDELTPTDHRQVGELLDEFSRKCASSDNSSAAESPGVRYVLASRITGWSSNDSLPGRPVEVELQPFTDDDVADFIDWYGLSSDRRLQLQAHLARPNVARLARTPLLLAMMCMLARGLTPVEQIPATRARLYDQLLRWFLTHPHRAAEHVSTPSPAEVGRVLDRLGEVAHYFATQSGKWVDLMDGDVLNRMLGPDELNSLSTGAGILVAQGTTAGGRPSPYLFMHRTVAEFLVARRLATRPGNKSLKKWWASVIDQVDKVRWFNPDWAEVIPMIGDLLGPEDAAQFIKWLADEPRDLFEQSFTHAMRTWATRTHDMNSLLGEDAQRYATRLVNLLTAEPSAYSLVAELVADTVTAELLRLAQDEFSGARETAAEALANREGELVTARLLELADDEDPQVRWVAVRGLAGRAGDLVTGRLVQQVDEDLYVGRAIVEALSGRAGELVTERLSQWISDDDETVSRAAVKALAGREGNAVTDRLLKLTADDQPSVRWAALEALAAREGQTVTDRLLQLSYDVNAGVRETAAEALKGRTGQTVTDRLLQLTTDRYAGTRGAAAYALSSRAGESVIDRLLQLATDENLGVRQTALYAVHDRAGDLATDRLLKLATHAGGPVRWLAVTGLADREGETVTDRLLQLASDDEPAMRREAAQALAGRDGQGVTDRLLQLTTDVNPGIRQTAVDALANRAGDTVTDRMLQLVTDQHSSVRHAVVAALARRSGELVTDRLLQFATDVDAGIREAAAEALADRIDEAVTERLLELTTDKEPAVRRAAAQALAGRPGKKVTDRLLQLIKDKDTNVREATLPIVTKLPWASVAPTLTAGGWSHGVVLQLLPAFGVQISPQELGIIRDLYHK